MRNRPNNNTYTAHQHNHGHHSTHHHTHHPVHHTHAYSTHSRRHGDGANGVGARKRQGEGKLMPPTDKVWAAKWKGEFKIAQVSGNESL